MTGQTPWQTVGPFFHFGLSRDGSNDLAGKGERITIAGKVTDGDGQPVPDALIEIWQADVTGRHAHPDDPGHAGADPTFAGFGRCATSEDGGFRFLTVAPGRVAGPGNSLQAPHIAVGILARGLFKRLVTRIYFANAPGNEEDPVLALVPDDRRHTLIAQHDGSAWRFDIVLQGVDETVFFAC